jgi:hypothetical protein
MVTARASRCKHSQDRCRRRPGKPTGSVNLLPRLRSSRFLTGMSLTIGFINNGFLGRLYRFEMRFAKPPTWSATCLASSASLTPGRAC